MSEAELRIHPSPEALAADVAERLLVVLRDAQAQGRVPQVVLTGGTVADVVHATIARVASSCEVDWRKVEFWWGDERYVVPDSPDRNEVQARAALLDHLDVDPARVHAVPSTSAGCSVGEAARAYGSTVRACGAGAFDVVMLGVGPDGHVASLFPGFPQVAVDDEIAVAVTGSPKPPPDRVSLTFPALNRTRETWLLVSGEGKAEAVRAALTGVSEGGPSAAEISLVPARGVHGQDSTVWFLDEAAASLLP